VSHVEDSCVGSAAQAVFNGGRAMIGYAQALIHFLLF
jgi:hypothetical protein